MTKLLRALPIALLAFTATAADAKDRPPTLEERAKIEAVLKDAGYTSWKEIELDDDDGWEVDDALHSDGKEYDLKLDPDTFAIKSRD